MEHLEHIEVGLHLETLSRVESLDTADRFPCQEYFLG